MSAVRGGIPAAALRFAATLLLATSGPAASQPVTPPRADGILPLRLLVAVEGARAVATDPDGLIYLSDPGAGRVLLVDSMGAAVGFAAEAATGRAMRPAGIDPTNGLVLLMADPAAGQILRFARDGRFIEAMNVDESVAPTSFGRHESASTDPAAGSPIDVATTYDGRMLIVDAGPSVLRLYDMNRRLLRTVGRTSGDDLPVRPVAVAGDGNRFFVADAGLPGVVVIDRFGGTVRTIGSGIADEPVDVASGDGRIWVMTANRVDQYTPDGRLVGRYRWEWPMDAVGVAESRGRLYVLGRDGLYVAPAPPR